MLKVLGTKVVVTIILLALANGGAGYALYEYVIPMRVQKDGELSALKAEIEARRQEVAKLKEEFVLLQHQLREYKRLEAQGFFNNQYRIKAQESLNEMRQLSGLLKTKYDISSGQLVEDAKAAEANHVVIKSPVKLEIDSLDDVDVYTFVKGVQEKFPGSVDIVGFKLDRVENVTAPRLREIGSGKPIKLVGATVEFDWRTMSNKDRLDSLDTSTSTGSQDDGIPDTVSDGAATEVQPDAPLPDGATADPAQPPVEPTTQPGIQP